MIVPKEAAERIAGRAVFYLDSAGSGSRIAAAFKRPAGIAQLVERNLAKVEVEGSSPFSRSRFQANPGFFQPGVLRFWYPAFVGAVAEWLRSGLQNRVRRFNSGRRLQNPLPWNPNPRLPFARCGVVAVTGIEPVRLFVGKF